MPTSNSMISSGAGNRGDPPGRDVGWCTRKYCSLQHVNIKSRSGWKIKTDLKKTTTTTTKNKPRSKNAEVKYRSNRTCHIAIIIRRNDMSHESQGHPKKHRNIFVTERSMIGKPGTRVGSCRIKDGVRAKRFRVQRRGADSVISQQ